MTHSSIVDGELSFTSHRASERLRSYSLCFERVEEYVSALLVTHDVPSAVADGVRRAALVAFGRRVASATVSSAEVRSWLEQTVRALTVSNNQVDARAADSRRAARPFAGMRGLSRRAVSLIAGYSMILNSTSPRDGETWLGNWVRSVRSEAQLTVEELAPLAGMEPAAWRRLERFPLDAASLNAHSLVTIVELFRMPFPLAAFQVRKGLSVGLPRGARHSGRSQQLHDQVAALLATARSYIVESGDTDLL